MGVTASVRYGWRWLRYVSGTCLSVRYCHPPPTSDLPTSHLPSPPTSQSHLSPGLTPKDPKLPGHPTARHCSREAFWFLVLTGAAPGLSARDLVANPSPPGTYFSRLTRAPRALYSRYLGGGLGQVCQSDRLTALRRLTLTPLAARISWLSIVPVMQNPLIPIPREPNTP